MFMNALEPVTLSPAGGPHERIGLGGTGLDQLLEPYNVARQFASLDTSRGARRGTS